MGFCRTPISEHLSTETRSESFKIHASHPWQPKTAGGFHEDHIELPYEDLAGLICDLIDILGDERPEELGRVLQMAARTVAAKSPLDRK